MTGPATLVTLATLAATAGIVLAAAMRTWAHTERRRDAARNTGVVLGHHTPDRTTHSHTDEGDPTT